MERKVKILQFYLIFSCSLIISIAKSELNPGGVKCGELLCTTTSEYCSQYDMQCRPCSIICDSKNHNHDLTQCVQSCQEYLHDQKYVLRAELNRNDNLKEEVEKLAILVKTSFALIILVTLVIFFFLINTFFKLKKIRDTLTKIFGEKWTKKNKNNNNVHNDVENGGSTVKTQQQNNARLIMPTISGRVAPSSQSSNGCATPNTTCTTLSQREATEDTALEFAYDNPALTSTPDTAANPKSKRESSF